MGRVNEGKEWLSKENEEDNIRKRENICKWQSYELNENKKR